MIKITAHKHVLASGYAGYEVDEIEGPPEELLTGLTSGDRDVIVRKDGYVGARNDKGNYYSLRCGEWYNADNFNAIVTAIKEASKRLVIINAEIAARRTTNADWIGNYTLAIDDDGVAMEVQ